MLLYPDQTHLWGLKYTAAEVQYVVQLSCQLLDSSLDFSSHLHAHQPVNGLPSQCSTDVETAHPVRWFPLTRSPIQRGSGRQTHLNSIYSSFEGCYVYDSVEFLKTDSLDHILSESFCFNHLIFILGRLETALKHL